MKNTYGRPTAPDYVCAAFLRAPESLIEEPEVCENCGCWQDGVCLCGDGADNGEGEST